MDFDNSSREPHWRRLLLAAAPQVEKNLVALACPLTPCAAKIGKTDAYLRFLDKVNEAIRERIPSVELPPAKVCLAPSYTTREPESQKWWVPYWKYLKLEDRPFPTYNQLVRIRTAP